MSREPSEAHGPDPDAIAAQSFTRARKGFEVDEVRAFLVSVSSQVREAQRQNADVERRLAELERRGADPRDLEVAEVSALLGEQTARVLDTARQAAAEMRSSAEEDATQLRADADAEATEARSAASTYDTATRAAADDYAHITRHDAEDHADRIRSEAAEAAEAMRSEAVSVLADRTAEAEAAAAAVRSDADGHVATVRSEADEYATATRSDADAHLAAQREAGDAYRAEAVAEGDRTRAAVDSEVSAARDSLATEVAEARDGAERVAETLRDAGRQEGRAMVAEARDYRERVIADLADRRRTARAQLDQLVASRDALAVALTDVAGRVDASYQSITATAIDPRALGDVATDRAALADRPLPEQLDDPLPEDAVEEASDPPADPDQPVEDSNVPDPEPPAIDELVSDSAHPGPDSSPEPDDMTAAEELVVEDARFGPDFSPEEGDADRAAALFAQIKAATEPDGAESDGAESGGAESDGAESGGAEQSAPDTAGADAVAPTAAADDTPMIEAVEVDETPEPVEEVPGPADVGAPPEPENVSVDESESHEPEPDPDADLLDRRDAATDEIERQLAKRLKRVLSDEQNEALDRLRRIRGEATAEEVLASEVDHRERYRAAAAEDLADAERAGAAFFGPAPSRPADIGDVADTFAADLVRALRGRLEAAFDDGGDEQEVGERIRACYREWKTQRIAEVARHSVQVAFGRGVAGYETELPTRWLVDHGGDAAPDCDDNALAGVVAAGDEYPTGDRHPPIHSGCRCLAVPAS